MKLRNKKTGEIKPAEAREDGIYLYDETTEQWYKYELDLLAKWWEYYKEPKEYWYINSDSVIYATDYGKYPDSDLLREEIGNYFSSKEDAEKAVEKLKAWKRLKDKGLELEGWKTWEAVTGKCCMSNLFVAHSYYAHFTFRSTDKLEKDETVRKDLDLLFGGEE